MNPTGISARTSSPASNAHTSQLRVLRRATSCLAKVIARDLRGADESPYAAAFAPVRRTRGDRGSYAAARKQVDGGSPREAG